MRAWARIVSVVAVAASIAVTGAACTTALPGVPSASSSPDVSSGLGSGAASRPESGSETETETGSGSPSPTERAVPSVIDPSPVVFAFDCRQGSGNVVEYTTYAAVWEAKAKDCTAVRITGSQPSEQQAAALAAAGSAATLRDLAQWCTITGDRPWTDAVSNAKEARIARALITYCPGHPERRILQSAVNAYGD